jgi:hypothetical protein
MSAILTSAVETAVLHAIATSVAPRYVTSQKLRTKAYGEFLSLCRRRDDGSVLVDESRESVRHGARTVPLFDVTFYHVLASLTARHVILRAPGGLRRYAMPNAAGTIAALAATPSTEQATRVAAPVAPVAPVAAPVAGNGTMRDALSALAAADAPAAILNAFAVTETADLIAMLSRMEAAAAAVRALIAEEGTE